MTEPNNFLAERLRLAPGIHLLTRNKTQIQLGLTPANSIQLPMELRKVFECCDGFTTVQHLIELAPELNLDPQVLLRTLELLVDRKLLIKATTDLGSLTKNQVSHLLDAQRATNSDPDLIAKRSSARLTIFGAGRLGSTIGLLLGTSGFANLRIIDPLPITKSDLTPWGASRLDVGLRRDYVTQTLLERIHKGQLRTLRQKETRSKPDLIIYAPDPVADYPWLNPTLADLALANDCPFIVAATAPTSALISSVLIPGNSSCLRCFHLNQTDRDPVWPQLITQLIGRQSPDLTPSELILRSAFFVYQELTRWLDYEQNNLNQWFQLSSDGESSSFEIYPHSECGCLWSHVQRDVS